MGVEMIGLDVIQHQIVYQVPDALTTSYSSANFSWAYFIGYPFGNYANVPLKYTSQYLKKNDYWKMTKINQPLVEWGHRIRK